MFLGFGAQTTLLLLAILTELCRPKLARDVADLIRPFSRLSPPKSPFFSTESKSGDIDFFGIFSVRYYFQYSPADRNFQKPILLH